MRTVWKFPFQAADHQDIEMPQGAKILHIDVQGDTPCLWALVDPSRPREKRHFRLAGTGHPIEEDTGIHVGSFMMMGGVLVFHLFDQTVRELQ